MKQLLFALLFYTGALQGFDTLHFFRPPPLFNEPRFEHKGLISTFTNISHGSTSCYNNSCGDTAPLSHFLGNKEMTVFHISEVVFDYCHNITDHIFVHAELPLRHLRFTTHTPDRIGCCGHTGSGDIGLGLGYTINYEDTEYIDFIDATAQLSSTWPTSSKAGPARCDLPLGYNGCTGMSLDVDSSVGIYDWLTFGAHGKILVLLPHHKQEIQDFVGAGLFTKADHMIFGFSFTFAYQYSHGLVQAVTAHGKFFSMHSINIVLDYDFATQSRPHGPTVGFTLQKIVGGKNVFLPTMKGGLAGVYMTWHF